MHVAGVYVRPYGAGWRGVARIESDDGSTCQRSVVLKSRSRSRAMSEAAEWADGLALEAAPVTGASAGQHPATDLCGYIASMVGSMEAAGSIEASTASDYRKSLARVARCLGGMAVERVTAADVRGMDAELSGSGLSPSAVRKAHGLLRQALALAVLDGLIGRNPADAVRKPKNAKRSPGSNSMAAAERARLLSALAGEPDTPTSVAARMSLLTGLRQGEACGLRWEDVDDESCLLWVRRAVGSGGSGPYLKSTKTDRARSVCAPEELMAMLSSWRSRQGCPPPRSYVLTGTGRFYDPHLVSSHWRALSRRLGLVGTEGRGVTFHDLRHTWATMAVAAGVDIRTVASNLGHANAAMTLGVYAAADPDAKRRAADVIQRAMRGEPPAD